MKLTEQLKRYEAAPGTQIHTGASGTEVPPEVRRADKDGLDVTQPDSRVRDEDVSRRQHGAEYFDGEGDQEGDRDGVGVGSQRKRSRLWGGKGEE